MVEFVIVLIVKRHAETVGIGHEKSESQKNKTECIKCNMRAQNEESDQRMDKVAQLMQGYTLANTQQQHSFKDFKISPNSIDIAASVLFPVIYMVFNVIYWWSLY